MFCRSCGSLLSEESYFCPNCGARLSYAVPYAGAQTAAGPSMTVNQELANLQVLLDRGIISEQEFYARRAQILSRPGVVVPPAPAPDSGSIGWWFLGFFVPIVGLILYLVWKDEKPLSARRAGWGALISVIVGGVLGIGYFAFIFWLMAMFY